METAINKLFKIAAITNLSLKYLIIFKLNNARRHCNTYQEYTEKSWELLPNSLQANKQKEGGGIQEEELYKKILDYNKEKSLEVENYHLASLKRLLEIYTWMFAYIIKCLYKESI